MNVFSFHRINNIFIQLSTVFVCLFLTACASYDQQKPTVQAEVPQKTIVKNAQCIGEVGAPALYVPWLTEVEDSTLLTQGIAEPERGGLCQGKTYKVNKPFEIFRAWNSNHPVGEKGKWWSFTVPSGEISQYRKEYAICPRFSPLDMMVRCTIKEGVHLALGTGQSAFCNQFLTYEQSPRIQIFLLDAEQSVMDCKSYIGTFSWQPAQIKANIEQESNEEPETEQ